MEEMTPYGNGPWSGESPNWSWVEVAAEKVEQAENLRKLYASGNVDLRTPSPADLIEQQTVDHLLALDSSLEEAIGKVKSEGRWKWNKSNDGGGGAYVAAGSFYLRSSNRDFVEMVAAFLAGDILTALQKRDEVNEQVFQSSP